MAGRSRWVLATALLAVLLMAPSLAHATLTFVRNPLKPVVWAAEDNGSRAHTVAPGTTPRVSPDGQIVAYSPVKAGSFSSELVVAPVSGSTAPHRLLGDWRDPSVFEWSPDSSTIAALRGPELGKRSLVLIDVACETGEVLCLRTGEQVVARGYFSGVSFSPDGGQLVYARSGSERYPPRSDVYRVGAGGGKPVRLTHDQSSTNPLWGPGGKIVFVKLLGAKQRKYGPKNELFLMNSKGGQVRRLTHTAVSPLAQGLYPTQWSANGKRLLAQFGGQDLTYAVTVNPRTGAQRPLVEATEQGFVGTALSADGRLVLGASGGGDPGLKHDVQSIPYGGGRPKTLAKNAFEPSWSR